MSRRFVSFVWQGNAVRFAAALQAEGLWPNIPAPTFLPANGTVNGQTVLTMKILPGISISNASIYFTSDGSDPRDFGGSLGLSSSLYNPALGVRFPATDSAGLAVLTYTIQARVLTAAFVWGPLQSTTYSFDQTNSVASVPLVTVSSIWLPSFSCDLFVLTPSQINGYFRDTWEFDIATAVYAVRIDFAVSPPVAMPMTIFYSLSPSRFHMF